MSAVVLTGDCRVVLGRFPENYFDAVVCDPPYGLEFMGKDWDAPWKGKASKPFNEIEKGSLGGFTNLPNYHRGNNIKCAACDKWKFSSNPCTCDTPAFPNVKLASMVQFQYWVTEWAVECLRVLKPGGHLIAFGGTRTYHRLACAIEDAGFEIRDQIQWLYGSGFPKSMNVGKAIDKAAGKTAPATPEAAQWEGWGTALKPAHEPIVLARKPFKGTVAANVLEHGTGALNIDGTRIPTNETITNHSRSADAAISKGKYGDSKEQKTHQTDGQKLGRWPANLILGHHEECEEVGTKKVKGSKGIRAGVPDGHGIYGKGFPRGDRREVGYVGEDGMETVEDWNCHPDCPIRMLDEQSGNLAPGVFPKKRGVDRGRSVYGKFEGQDNLPGGKLDGGGASRFFYQAKASKKEREAGLDDFQPASLGAKGNGLARTCNTCGASVIGGCECPDRTYSNPKRKNNHPTVKPIALMRYLIRLVTPPGGRVLDPFTGSGTTGIAAVLEGFNFVGVELDPEYVTLAQARIKHWTPDA